jgi:hypothetical protein
MSAPRLVGLFLTALFLTVVTASAQIQPPVKPPANPKPGDPGKKPPGKGDPKMPPGKGDSKLPPIVVAPPGGKAPVKKKDDIKWPKEVNGKTAEVVVKEMKSSDPGLREAAVRTLPLFGPRGRELGGAELVEVLTGDRDWSVRLAALSVSPVVLFGHLVLIEGDTDKLLIDGMNATINMANSEQLSVRFEALKAIAAYGPFIRYITAGKVISVVVNRARDPLSWHMRVAGVAALGQIGMGIPKSEEEPEERGYPDQASVNALLDILRQDACSAVRREAINSLILLGTVAPSEQKKWRAALDSVLARDKDKSIQLWTRVCILANDPAGVKGNQPHLDAVAVVLQAPEAAGRLEACQAFARLGDDAASKLQDLLNLIQKPNEEPAIVAAGIAAVATMKSQAKITLPIMDNLKLMHPNAEVKRVAAEAADILRKKD